MHHAGPGEGDEKLGLDLGPRATQTGSGREAELLSLYLGPRAPTLLAWRVGEDRLLGSSFTSPDAGGLGLSSRFPRAVDAADLRPHFENCWLEQCPETVWSSQPASSG